MDYIFVSYKHPKLRKLDYITFLTMKDAEKAPKEIQGRLGTYLQYGIHVSDGKWMHTKC